MESIPLPDQQDLVMANASLQWAGNPAALLVKMVECLRPGGILAIATFGPLNLQETASLTGLSLRYLSVNALRAHLDGRAEILQCEEELRRLTFTSAMDVLRHLKHTGVNGLGTFTWSRRDIARFCAGYQARFGRGGSVTLTYHPILLIARRNETSSAADTT
jgi:SAM-dependent methyltransferase